LKVVLDENLPPALARALNALVQPEGHSFEHVSDLGLSGKTDVEIFSELGRRDISVHITADHHGRKPAERQAIAQSGLVVFVLEKSWASQNYWTKAERLVRWCPAILQQADRIAPPAMFGVPFQFSGTGKFKQLRLA